MTLQSRSNAKHSSGKYSWAAIGRLVQKMTGQSFDYETFQAKYDANPALQHIVADFNDHGITLNVKKKKHDTVTTNLPKHDVGINKSAKQAASKTIQRNRG